MPRTLPAEYRGRIGKGGTRRSVHHLATRQRHSGSYRKPPRTPYDGGVRVSSKGDYACRALLSLALHDTLHDTQHDTQHDTAPRPTSVRDIAERTAIPQPYLEQILLALKGAGLVRSKRGVGGGYVLARPPAEIRISEILSAVDGPISLGDFGEPHQDGACNHEGQCVLLAIWKTAGEHMRLILGGFTLQSVADAARGTAPWPDALVEARLSPLPS